jgi:Tol biopolymer transport system component
MYRSVQSEPLSYDLFVKRADGNGPAEVLLDPEQNLAEGLWSSDGQWLVVRTDPPQNIYATQSGVDSEWAPLFDDGFDQSSPALSPNGRWLAYVSNESGQNEIYVRSFPNAALTKRQISTGGGVEPRWAHSGRELFYKSPARELVAVSVDAEETFAAMDRQVLFTFGPSLANTASHPRYSVAPDDQSFLTYQSPGLGEGLSEVVVAENFLEELKAKVGN